MAFRSSDSDYQPAVELADLLADVEFNLRKKAAYMAELDSTTLRNVLDSLLGAYGGQDVLRALGKCLQESGASGNAPAVGKTVESLAEVDW